MSHILSKETEERILKMVKEKREGCSRVEIGRRLLIKRHCGMKMVQVKTFYPSQSCSNHHSEHQGTDVYVCACPGCLHIEDQARFPN